MSQAARPSLTVAQLHTPLTNIPTLAHALTSGDGLDKVGIHQLLSGFAERADGKTWDFTVSRKRSRANREEPSNDTDDDDVDEQELVVDDEERSSAPTTPMTPIPTPTTTRHRAKRQRRGAARASPSFDERQDAGELGTVTKGKAKIKKVEAEDDDQANDDHQRNNNNNNSNNRNRAATSTRSSRSRRRVAQKTTPRNSRRRKELKFEDEEQPAAEAENNEDKVQGDDAEVDQNERSTTTTTTATTTTQAYVPGDEQHQGGYLASLQEASFVPASDRLSVVGDDGLYGPARLYGTPHPMVGRRHSHSLIFPLLHSLEQQPHPMHPQHQHPYDDSMYDYNRYPHSRSSMAPTPTFGSPMLSNNNTPLFAPPPTPPPPPAGTWYSMLMEDSTPPPPPPPPAPLNAFQVATAASPQLTPLSARHYQNHYQHYPSSPSMPLSSPEYVPQHCYSYGGERAPSPHTTTLGGGDHPWAWLSEADEEEIVQFLRSTPAQAQPEPQPTFNRHQQQPQPQQLSGAEADLVAQPDGLLLLGCASESAESRTAMARMRMSLMRLREATSPMMMPSWATTNLPPLPSGFATSFPPFIDHVAPQLPRFSFASSSSSSRSPTPFYSGRASGGALSPFYGGGHCSMPSSASSSHPSSPYTMVDTEILYTTTLPSVDLSLLSASPLLLPVLHTTAATTSMTPTQPRTPSSLLRSTTSRRRRSPTTGQGVATTSTSIAQTPKRRKSARKANNDR